MTKAVDAILNFWFGDPDDPSGPYGEQRSIWFNQRDSFDQEVQDRFLTDYGQAAAGQLTEWKEQPLSCLALILLLDQFPRNLFRGTLKAFATDTDAVAIAEWAVDRKFDQAVISVQRLFFYLPFEHSENLVHQQRAVELCRQLWQAHPNFKQTYDYAVRHAEVVERFGRFPHRNKILGRASTPEEQAFLQQPGSSF